MRDAPALGRSTILFDLFSALLRSDLVLRPLALELGPGRLLAHLGPPLADGLLPCALVELSLGGGLLQRGLPAGTGGQPRLREQPQHRALDTRARTLLLEIDVA